MTPILMILSALALNSILMTGFFYFARRINNFSIVDAVWAAAFLFTTLSYSILSPAFPERRLIWIICVAF